VATGHKHRDYHYYLPDGIPHSEHPESRCRAIHLKLDELIRCLDLAHNDMINVEKLSDEELAVLSNRFDKIRDEFENRKRRKRRTPQKRDRAA
jgi:low affinity Fe/Cu permease